MRTLTETEAAEFRSLAERYRFSNQTIGVILDRHPQVISRYMRGYSPIPATALSTLRVVVAAIDAALK